MPQPLASLTRDVHYRLLVLGAPKLGKTTHVVTTAPRPVRVICCEHNSALAPALEAARQLRIENDISYDVAPNEEAMLNAVIDAKRAAKNGDIKTLVVDPLTAYTSWLESYCIEHNDNPDGRAAYRPYNQKGRHLINLLMTVPCHVVAVCHYNEVPGKDSTGRVPAIAGQLGGYITTQFQNIVWMDLDTKGHGADNRMFVTGASDFWGPGCRYGGKGLGMVPADVSALFKAFSGKRRDDAEPPRRNGVRQEARR